MYGFDGDLSIFHDSDRPSRVLNVRGERGQSRLRPDLSNRTSSGRAAGVGVVQRVPTCGAHASGLRNWARSYGPLPGVTTTVTVGLSKDQARRTALLCWSLQTLAERVSAHRSATLRNESFLVVHSRLGPYQLSTGEPP